MIIYWKYHGEKSKMYESKNALVVLNYNDSSTTTQFLKMAIKSEEIEHIVVVDNCSNDDSYQELKKYENEKIVVIKTLKNGGYAYGNNYGCKYAIENYNPRILIVSNPDVTFENNVIENMEKIIEQNDEVGVVAPIVNQGYNIWNRPGYFGVIESIFLIWFNLDKKRIKKSLIKTNREWSQVGVVEGSFWAIDVEAFTQVEGFDERTFLYYEENIFAKKIIEKGYIEAALNKCRYNHYHSVSIKKKYGGKARAFKNFHESMLIYLKHYLNVNVIGMLVFELAFGLGYIERLVYDCIVTLKRLKSDKH